MAYRYLWSLCIILALLSCTAEKPTAQKKPAPVVLVKPKIPVLSPGQRKELGFSSGLIEQIEYAADAVAEPYFATVVMQTENLKGEKGIESKMLAGFSVHTKKSDELMDGFRVSLRTKGYVMFKTYRGYGTLKDIVTVVRGNNSYDILSIQRTEGMNYHLDTKAIIAWLKRQQKDGSFLITGAGQDWVEAKFVRRPHNMLAFAKKVSAFAPDVLARDTPTVEKLAEHMEQTNGFYLSWD
jgi:Domain of unknown function (DUF4253)